MNSEPYKYCLHQLLAQGWAGWRGGCSGGWGVCGSAGAWECECGSGSEAVFGAEAGEFRAHFVAAEDEGEPGPVG